MAFPFLLQALDVAGLPRLHLLYNVNPQEHSMLRIRCNTQLNQTDYYLKGGPLNCQFTQTMVSKESKEKLKEKLDELPKTIDSVMKNEDEIRSFTEVCSGIREYKIGRKQKKIFLDFCKEIKSSLKTAITNFLYDMTYFEHESCSISNNYFDLDFVYQPMHKAWESTNKPSICNITNIVTLTNEERYPNLWTFTQNRIVHEQSNNDEFCKNLESSKVVFSWKGDRSMEMNCRSVSLSP